MQDGSWQTPGTVPDEQKRARRASPGNYRPMKIVLIAVMALTGCGGFSLARGLRAFGESDNMPRGDSGRQTRNACSSKESCQWLAGRYECYDACGNHTRSCYPIGGQMTCDYY